MPDNANQAAAAQLEHLDRMVRSWLGLRGDADAPTLPDELARLVLRAEEHERPHRDRFDSWEFAFSENFRRGMLWEPEIDRWLAAERSRLPEAEPLWPDGKRFAFATTHDVDMISRASSPAQILRGVRRKLTTLGDAAGRERVVRLLLADGQPGYWRFSLLPSAADTLERCLDVEEKAGIRGTYFFALYPGARSSPYDCLYALDDVCVFRGRRRTVAAVIRELSDEGHEIGLHGSYRSSSDATLLEAERRMLEDVADRPVTTTRQHLLRWDVRATPRVQARAGIATDSSLGFNRNVGFRAGTALPFRPFDLDAGETLDVLELPLVLQDGALVAGDALGLDQKLAREVSTQLLETVADTGGVATLLFHPHSFIDSDITALFRHTIEHAQSLGAWIAPLGEIASWWRNRESRLGLS